MFVIFGGLFCFVDATFLVITVITFHWSLWGMEGPWPSHCRYSLMSWKTSEICWLITEGSMDPAPKILPANACEILGATAWCCQIAVSLHPKLQRRKGITRSPGLKQIKSWAICLPRSIFWLSTWRVKALCAWWEPDYCTLNFSCRHEVSYYGIYSFWTICHF